MFEQDYLMRQLVQVMDAMRKSRLRVRDDRDPRGAARLLEDAVGDATELDGEILLSLAPESMASILQVSGVDPRVAQHVANSLALEARYLREAGDVDASELRAAQARALAEGYGLSLVDADDDAALDELLAPRAGEPKA